MYNRVVAYEAGCIGWDPTNAEQTGTGRAGDSYCVVDRRRRASALRWGRMATPSSVTMAEISRAGVMSKAGLAMAIPLGVPLRPPTEAYSSPTRCATGIAAPDAQAKSMVDTGAAT
jgi:hypothetical protein